MSTRLERLTVLPGDASVSVVSDKGVQELSVRESMRLDEFAAELGKSIGVVATVHDGPYPAVSPNEVVVCRADALERLLAASGPPASDVATRAVLLDVPHSQTLHEAERHGLAAVVETIDYLNWLSAHSSGPAAIYGRKDVAERMMAVPSSRPHEVSARYVRFTHPDHPGLPSLLGAYLAVYTSGLAG